MLLFICKMVLQMYNQLQRLNFRVGSDLETTQFHSMMWVHQGNQQVSAECHVAYNTLHIVRGCKESFAVPLLWPIKELSVHSSHHSRHQWSEFARLSSCDLSMELQSQVVTGNRWLYKYMWGDGNLCLCSMMVCFWCQMWMSSLAFNQSSTDSWSMTFDLFIIETIQPFSLLMMHE